jgi:hypothetical protein
MESPRPQFKPAMGPAPAGIFTERILVEPHDDLVKFQR